MLCSKNLVPIPSLDTNIPSNQLIFGATFWMVGNQLFYLLGTTINIKWSKFNAVHIKYWEISALI
jgi:hypothetical protein